MTRSPIEALIALVAIALLAAVLAYALGDLGNHHAKPPNAVGTSAQLGQQASERST